MIKTSKYFICCILLICFACGKNNQKGKEKETHIVTLPMPSDIRSLDPRVSIESPSLHLMKMMYEGFMRLGPNGEIVPGMAESVSISQDQKTYTFQLKKAHWSNGDLVTAYDFEHAWKEAVNPSSPKFAAFNFSVIKNVEPCLQKKVALDQVGIWALDEKTLQVELEHPAPYFLSLCSCVTHLPIHKGCDLNHPNWANDLSPHFVTNGPFRMKQWKKGVEIPVEKNPYYWEANDVKLDGIQIQILPDAHNQFLLFQKGKLDWIGCPFANLPPDLVENALNLGELQVIDMCGFTAIYTNTQTPPFNNANFRKALSYAIDRKSIATHVFQLGEKPAMGILNEDIAVTDQPYFEDGNVELAQYHLSLALEEMGKTLQELGSITLSQRDCPLISRMTQAIQQQLYSNLGIQVSIHRSDWPVHWSQIIKGEYQMGEGSWVSWITDPIYNLNAFRRRDVTTNFSQWEHPTYQKILKQADYELDVKKRKEYLHQAEDFLMKEMPMIPICFSTLHFLCNPQLKGVYLSPLREIDFRYAYFEPK